MAYIEKRPRIAKEPIDHLGSHGVSKTRGPRGAKQMNYIMYLLSITSVFGFLSSGSERNPLADGDHAYEGSTQARQL